MRQLLKSKWLRRVIAVLGFGFLASYLVFTGNWRFSLAWAFAVPTISFSVAWLLVRLLSDRLPALNRYFLYPSTERAAASPLSPDEWAAKQADYLDSLFSGKTILFVPAEDALICVPVLLAGIDPLSALVGGTTFGAMHLARFSYRECIGKAIYYTMIVYFVLPHGLLTVAAGHLIMDGVGLAAIRIAKNRLAHKLRSER